jgi:hypothetical protein
MSESYLSKGATVGLIGRGASPPSFSPLCRRWKVRCTKCGENVAIIRLPVGELEGWLLDQLVCPSGKHTIEPAGYGLKVSIFYGREEMEKNA